MTWHLFFIIFGLSAACGFLMFILIIYRDLKNQKQINQKLENDLARSLAKSMPKSSPYADHQRHRRWLDAKPVQLPIVERGSFPGRIDNHKNSATVAPPKRTSSPGDASHYNHSSSDCSSSSGGSGGCD